MPASATLLIVLMLATLLVLIIGIIFMAIGKKYNEKYANKLMVARVTLQGLAIVLVGLIYMLYHQSQ